MAKKKRITDWYKEKIEENLSSPPIEVWENIENKLDIYQVWERVSTRLDKIKLFSTIKKITYYSAAAITLFLILEYFVTKRSTDESPDQESLSRENTQDRPKDVYQIIVENTEKEIDTITDDPQNLEKPPEISGENDYGEIPLEIETTEIATRSIMTDHPPVEPGSEETKSKEGLVKVDSIEKITPIETINKELLAESTYTYSALYPPYYQDLASTPGKSNLYLHGFYFGISMQIGNTWLINSTTFNGLKSSDLTTTVPYLGKSFSLLAGTNLTEKFTLQLEGAIIDEAGQKYYQYIHGKYVTKVLNLDYLTFNIHLKYSRSHLWTVKTPVSSNIIFGSYAGYLKSASEIIDTEIENIKYDYKNLDYGILLGYEFDFYLKRRLVISSGIRFKIGLPNVYAGNELIPSNFNKTKTASVNLIFGIKYFIPRK